MQLHLEQNLTATPARVFAAFVEASQLREWWGPAGFAVTDIQFEAAEGAAYRITMKPPDSDAFHLRGTFTAVDSPNRLAFTFVWEEPDPDDQETQVDLTFMPTTGGTLLVLDHGPFKTTPRWELHRDGWTETLGRLTQYLS